MTSRGSFPPVPAHPPRSLHSQPPAAVALEEAEALPSFDWRRNAWLFALTVLSVFYVGSGWVAYGEAPASAWEALLAGWRFALPLLAILVAHEFGHYIAARLHRVPASLPYFIPLPILNPFGTLGAIILMPKRIRSRRALLDIGAAGPLAGMAVAIPLMIYGLSLSPVLPVDRSGDVGGIQEGQSLLYWALKALVHGTIPADHDVMLHPTALAAWAGFLVTFLNLLPFGQLDGGHVAYAVFGERQNRFARFMLYVPLLLVVHNFFVHVAPILQAGFARGFDALTLRDWLPASALFNWIVLFGLLLVLRRASGADHPPVDDHTLGTGRKLVGIGTLLLFVLLFMPSPWVPY